MKIVIVTFDGFNEIDSFVALNILNRVNHKPWQADIVAPNDCATSMNGVKIQTRQPFSSVNQADVVLFGSGRLTREVIQDEALMAQFQLDSSRQLIGSQCSGALILQRLGLVENLPICTDLTTREYFVGDGIRFLDQPFVARGNIAMAGGCLSAPYLASWVIYKALGRQAVIDALRYVAPVGEEGTFFEQILAVVEPFVNTCSNSRTRSNGYA